MGAAQHLLLEHHLGYHTTQLNFECDECYQRAVAARQPDDEEEHISPRTRIELNTLIDKLAESTKSLDQFGLNEVYDRLIALLERLES